MPRLLRLIASQSANLFKARDLSDKLGISHETVESYVSLLEAIFLVRRLRAWAPGKPVENFVAIELVRHAGSSEQNPEVFHYRRDRDELDLVLENRAGEICAIDVKSSSKIRGKDWAALQRLRDARSKSFICGVLLYTGSQAIKLSDRIHAVPPLRGRRLNISQKLTAGFVGWRSGE